MKIRMSIYKKVFVILTISSTIFWVGYIIFERLHSYVTIIEHAQTHPLTPPESKDICFASLYRDFFWEANMDVNVFDRMIKSKNGHSVDFRLQVPLKIGRYTILKSFKIKSKQLQLEEKYLKPTEENKMSCFHFVKQGKIGVNTGQTLFIYDNENGRAYVTSPKTSEIFVRYFNDNLVTLVF